MSSPLVANLLQPLLRLLPGMILGLLLAQLLEALGWTRFLARLASPLVRFAHLGEAAGAAFALAFFSPSAGNALLAKAHDAGELSRRELMFANLFNSLPNFLIHLPTMFLLAWPVLGPPAATYAGLCLAAAAGRTFLTAMAAHVLLPPPAPASRSGRHEPARDFRRAARTAWTRFRRRVPRLVFITVPVYVGMYLLQQYGLFEALQNTAAEYVVLPACIKPQALGIIALYLAAEAGAALSAAGSLLHAGGLDSVEVVTALLAGNILSTPMRALRHQFPSYAGFFKPARAFELMLANQTLRALAMIGVTLLYLHFVQE